MMAIKRLNSHQLKTAGFALGASALAAIAMMFVPVGLLESITGATGISEMVHATAAPLGDTARAIMAFLAGALTLVAVLAVMLRTEKGAANVSTAQVAQDFAEPADRISALRAGLLSISLPKFAMPKMPWKKSDGDIFDLADLPKLRTLDAHPDAPARRPLSAASDLNEPAPVAAPAPAPSTGEIRFWGDAMPEPAVEPVAHATACEDVADVAPIAVEVMAETKAGDVAITAAPAAPRQEPQLTLAEMVAQLEAAVVQRKVQLAELEVVAADLAASNKQPTAAVEVENIVVAPAVETEILPPEAPRAARPPLEAVPSSPRGPADDDMDAALHAALQTLQRMNAQAR